MCTSLPAARLERLAARLESHRPAAQQARRRAALESARTRLMAAMKDRLARLDVLPLSDRLIRSHRQQAALVGERLEGLAKRLAAVGPASVLRRGFSYTMREDGTIVKSVTDARPGDVLQTTVSDGVVRSVVPGAGPPSPAMNSSATNRKGRGRDQMDLFGTGR